MFLRRSARDRAVAASTVFRPVISAESALLFLMGNGHADIGSAPLIDITPSRGQVSRLNASSDLEGSVLM